MLFSLFRNYWLILLIPTVIAQVCNPTAELGISIGIPTNKAKKEIEVHPVIAEI